MSTLVGQLAIQQAYSPKDTHQPLKPQINILQIKFTDTTTSGLSG